MVDPELAEQPGHGLPGLARFGLTQFHDCHDVFLDRHAPEDGWLLRQVPQAHARALVHGLGSDVLPVQPDRALVGGDQASDHVEAGGLAGSVRTQQPLHLTPAEAQGHALDHGAAAGGLADPVDDQTFLDRSLHVATLLRRVGRGARIDDGADPAAGALPAALHARVPADRVHHQALSLHDVLPAGGGDRAGDG